MNYKIAIGITIGVLAGILVILPASLGLLSWVCFIAWACYYAAGGGVKGLYKAVAANLSGVIYGFLMVLIAGLLGFSWAIGITVAVFAFCMCAQAHLDFLSFIPGAFCGAAAFFGAGATANVILPVAISLVVGALLAILSDILGKAIMKKEPEKK